MPVIRALTGTTEALVTGTPDQRRQAQRERQAAQIAHAIISTKTEIPRNELEFGPRWIAHTPTGNLYWIFGGDPSFAPTVHHYYVTQDGTPIMLEPANPPSMAEIERRQAAKEKRRADRAAAAKARNEERRRALR